MRPSLALSSAVMIVALAAPATPGLAGTPTMVAWAPGFPGSTKEAQPTMDALAGAVAAAAKLPPDGFAAVYQETEKGGLARLSQPDAAGWRWSRCRHSSSTRRSWGWSEVLQRGPVHRLSGGWPFRHL